MLKIIYTTKGYVSKILSNTRSQRREKVDNWLELHTMPHTKGLENLSFESWQLDRIFYGLQTQNFNGIVSLNNDSITN